MNIIALKSHFDRYQVSLTAQEELKKEIKSLQEKLGIHSSESDGLKGLMLAEVKSSGETTVKIGAASLILTAGKDSMVIEDESQIPAQYTTTSIVVNKTAVKAALANGSEVPGAKMVTGADYLTIR